MKCVEVYVYACKRPLCSQYLLSIIFASMVTSMFSVSHQWWASMSRKQVVCVWLLKHLTLTSNGRGIVATSVSHHQTKFAFGNIWNLMMWLGSTKNKSRIMICGSAGQFMEDREVKVHFVHGKSVCVSKILLRVELARSTSSSTWCYVYLILFIPCIVLVIIYTHQHMHTIKL